MSCAMAIILIAIAACGGDGSTQPDSTLSADQVRSMSTSLRRLLALSLLPAEASVALPVHADARRVMSLSTPIQGAHACPEGGHLGVHGSLSANDAGQIVFALSDTLTDCGIVDDSSIVWTFTTQPTIESSIVESVPSDSTEQPALTIQENDAGQVKFATGSLTGTCSIDVTVETQFFFHTPTADSNTVTTHTSGSLCDRALASDTSVTTAAPAPP
jgi:hypothetical protein